MLSVIKAVGWVLVALFGLIIYFGPPTVLILLAYMVLRGYLL